MSFFKINWFKCYIITVLFQTVRACNKNLDLIIRIKRIKLFSNRLCDNFSLIDGVFKQILGLSNLKGLNSTFLLQTVTLEKLFSVSYWGFLIYLHLNINLNHIHLHLP